MCRFQPFIDLGLLPQLLPIIPPGAKIAPHSNLSERDAGKQPGFYNAAADDWIGLSGWSSSVTTPDDITAWRQWPGDAVGLKTGHYPGIDFDIDDPALVNKLNQAITLMCGDTATRTRDNSARMVRVFKLAAGEIPQGKWRIILNNNLGAIELLGAGQQVVLSGTHPSGAMQTFHGTPLEITIDQLNAMWITLISMLGDLVLKTTKAGDSGLTPGNKNVAYVAEDVQAIEQARQYIAAAPGVGEGERDDECFKLAAYVRQYIGIEPEQCNELIASDWAERCDPPFPAREVTVKVNSAYGGGARGAQGEYSPAFVFANPVIPDYVSPVPLEPKKKKKEKPKQPQPPISPTGLYDINYPINTAEWEETHKAINTGWPYTTLLNFEKMLRLYGIYIAYDVIKKKMLVNGGPEFVHGSDISDNANRAIITNCCKMNHMDTGIIDEFLYAMQIKNEVNPVKEWINSTPWDGEDRINALFNTLVLDDQQDKDLAYMLFRKWLSGACKIVQRKIPKFEHVLVLQQQKGGEGKTSWFNKLCPYEQWRKDGVSLDPSDKDTVKQACSHWLVELGELDSLFRKSDIKRLMAFLSNERDEIRLPYSRNYNEYQRRTAFFGTVNKREFLIDDSGDRRFWPISVKAVNYEHDIDMQQLWSQVDMLSEREWLNRQELDWVINENNTFKSTDPIDEKLEMFFSKPVKPGEQHMNVTSILNMVGYVNPNRTQLSKAKDWLIKMNYRQSKNHGVQGFWIPILSVFNQ